MPILKRRQLNEKIVESVQMCGWNVLFGSRLSDLPLDIRIHNDDESITLKIYSWNLSHGGATRNADEYRIQTKVDRFEQVAEVKTLVLGWWDDVGVFAGFDVRKHSGVLGYSSSIQINQNTLRRAVINGFSAHDKGNEEIAVAFTPDFLVDYIKNLESLHDLGEAARDLIAFENVIERAVEEDFVINDADIEEISEPRQSVVKTVTQKVRQTGFKRRVLTAYSSQCAFCGIQLKLVDAAHIVPVAHEESTDHTSNGLALCPLHHRAFDHKLITINEEYETLINLDRVNYLRAIGHDNGMDEFAGRLRPMIYLPPDHRDRPNVRYVSQANEWRGWREYKVTKLR
jgi:putative restriction endonuclease